MGRRIAIPIALVLLAASAAAAGTRLLAPVLLPLEGSSGDETGTSPSTSTTELPEVAWPGDGGAPELPDTSGDAGAHGAPPTPPTRRRANATDTPGAPDEPPDPLAIERDDRGAFVLSRTQIEEQLASGEGIRGARAHRQELPGGVVGFRLAGVGRGPLGRLGLRDGDVLTAVNGLRVDSADAALGAFQRLRSAGSLRVTVMRGGSPRTIHYRIE